MTAQTLKKQALFLAGCTVMAGAFGLMTAQNAHAATLKAADGACVKQVSEAGKAVTKFDYNADGTADAVSWTVKSAGVYNTSMTLNIGSVKKTIISKSSFYTPTVYMIQFDNGKTAVYVIARTDNDVVVLSKLYYIKSNGKMGTLLSLKNSALAFKSKYAYASNNSVASVTGNKIKISCSGQPYACGVMSYSYTYKYTKNGLERTSDETSVKVSFRNDKKTVAASPITTAVKAYKTVAADKKQTVSIPSGTKVTVMGGYFTSKLKLLKVKYTASNVTTTAYIDITKYTSVKNPLFKYAVFVG